MKFSFGSLFGDIFGDSSEPPRRTFSQLLAEHEQLRSDFDALLAEHQRLLEENEQLTGEVNRLAGTSSGVRQSKPAVPAPTLGRAPDFPEEIATVVADMPKEAGWAHLKASVLGFGKASLQDAHAVVTQGHSAVLIVCDGAGSKKCSKEGADFAVKFLADKLTQILATGDAIRVEHWNKLSQDLLLEAAEKLEELAQAAGQPLQEYGATCIIAFANDEFAACSHVGDGRAGYLDPKGVWRSMMIPYKGAEANATIFLSMLKPDNAAEFVRHKTIPGRIRAIMALSDGPEGVCWHVSTKGKDGVDKLIDPNMPSANFFGKIANQLAGASAKKVSQEDLDGFWAKFLATGNEQLAAVIDDKTLLIALRG